MSESTTSNRSYLSSRSLQPHSLSIVFIECCQSKALFHEARSLFSSQIRQMRVSVLRTSFFP